MEYIVVVVVHKTKVQTIRTRTSTKRMFSLFSKYATTQRLGKVGIVIGTAATSVAFYQAQGLRKKYVDSPKLEPPEGPVQGLERFHRLLNSEKDQRKDVIMTILRELKTKVTSTLETKTDHSAQGKRTLREKFSEKWDKLKDVFKRKKEKKIKLILLGDSLVCGVGCDDSNNGNLTKTTSIKSTSSSSSQSLSLSGPVLPQIVAKVLSVAMRADVEWSSIGIVGGTVAELRSVLLPQIRQQITSVSPTDSLSIPSLRMINNVDKDTEVFVVIICGLNDFKQITDHFPFNSGPAAFKEELGKLVEDIRLLGQELSMNFQVFLPAIPIVVGRGDPTCNIMIPPLSTFLEYIAYLWDEQKKAIASENHERITYIDAPNLDKHYATPGKMFALKLIWPLP